MERIKSLGVVTPVLKVNNRNNNIAFYQKTLGLKVWNEESAFTDLGTKETANIKLILEESPSMRSRKAVKPKKLNQIIAKAANSDEVETLLARGASYDRVYKGARGWAFECTSPEGDCFLLHSEEDLANLVPANQESCFKDKLADFTYLTQFELEKIKINTPDAKASQNFYSSLFNHCALLEFVQAEGPDLRTENDRTWDLAALELDLTVSISLATIQADLAAKGIPSFVDKRATFLSFQDPSGLDIVLRP